MASDQTPTPPRRFCNVTFVEEGSPGPDGVPIKLQRCTRCKGVYYASRELQQQHWKVHKAFCMSPNEFDYLREHIFESSATEAADLLSVTFQSFGSVRGTPETPAEGFIFLWVLQRLEQLAREGDATRFDSLHYLAGNFVRVPNEGHREAVEQLWAVPGMATFLLNVDLRSDAIKERILQHPRDIMPPAEWLAAEGNQEPYQLNSDFCDLVASIIHGSAVRMLHSSPTFRGTPIALAATRKVISWCRDPWALASMPKLFEKERVGPTAREVKFLSLLLVLVQKLGRDRDTYHPTEIAPCLSLEDATRSMLWFLIADGPFLDRVNRLSVLMTRVKLLHRTKIEQPFAWTDFSVDHRVDLAVLIVRNFIDGEVWGRGCAEDILVLVTGWRIDDAMWLNVTKKALTCYEGKFFHENLEKGLTKVRKSAREFVNLHGVEVPDDVEELICEFGFETRPLPWTELEIPDWNKDWKKGKAEKQNTEV